MSPNYEVGSIVWVKLGQKWWPGRVSSLDECPVQYVGNLKKNPLAIVRFFNESEYHDVSKPEHIFPYSCTRKNDIIRKGLNSMKYDLALGQKFEADVAMAEKLTGGNMEIVKELKEMTRAKIDYSDLGFGTRKPKKPSKDQCMQRKGFSDIGEAIQYKRGSSPLSSTVIEHKTKIMEQPKLKVEEMKEATNWFKCYICGFTCGRLNVIIWHNKVHLKKVEDYDSGIRLPGRRKRRRKTQRNKMKKILKSEEVDHSQTNGHASPKRDPSREASQLLLDWEDEDDDDQGDNEQEMKVDNSIDEEIPVNGVDNNDENDGDTSDDFDNDSDDDDDYDNEYPTHKGQRQPMPKQVDINSAFDALLAESSPLHKNNQNSSYINNDSDSECSDWEKYYAKSDEEKEEEEEEGDNESDSKSGVEENQQNGHHHSSQSSKAYSSKRSNPLSSTESSNGMVSQEEKQSSSNSSATSKSESKKGLSSSDYIKKGKFKTKSRSRSPQPRKSSKGPSAKEADSPASPGPSISKSSSPLPERTREEQSEEHSTHSSSSSTSSGPAYMLVAVDAHGNNVPMPVLSEGGNHLVAVEASMEDGTTRTLYIDPAHLGPNVDLNNLMLHIDNSGQETVIIPTSTSDGEIISSTLVEQPAQDSSTKPEEEKEEDTPGDGVSHPIELKEENAIARANDDLVNVKTYSTTAHEKPRVKTGNMSTKELLLKQREKREKVTDSDFQVQLIEEVEEDYDDDDDDDELPDLEACDPRAEKFFKDQVVWVMTHGLWWPSFVLKTYPKENKASILYINCQQKTPIKVHLNRLKTFSYLDYSDIFESQKDKAAGLTEAMDMASRYREVKAEGAIKLSPREFFHLSILEQKSIIDKQILALRRRSIFGSKAMAEDSPKSSSSSVFEQFIDDDEDGEEIEIMKSKRLKIETPEISDDRLSERDMLKLASATKARRTSNERFVRYIKSEACLEFLRKICVRKLPSERHDYFVENHRNFNFLMVISGVHPVGLNFFGEDDVQQTEEVITYLIKKFETEEIIPSLDFSNRKVYVNTVLFPEAVKESLRAVAKIPEEELETVLENGLFHTRTELKAKRLDYS